MTQNASPRPQNLATHVPDGDPSVDVDVLVVGAGPTGLTAAAEALRNGLSVRIVERLAKRGTFSKALVVHARTMEVFSLMGIEREVLDRGVPFAALNLNFDDRKRRVRVDLLDQPWGDTEYPYWLSVPQCDTEVVLEHHLNRLGGEVEWSSSLHTLKDHGTFVEASVKSERGTETIRARWVIGCDGGRSTVRDQAGLVLERTGAGATFLLADVSTTSDLIEDEGHMYLAPEGMLIIVPMPKPRQWRIIAHVSSESAGVPSNIDAERLNSLIEQRAGIQFGAHDVTWTSQFDLSHGVADHFRSGRVFVAGDAAHIHSPVGGQGLNTGVQDAHNLVWRLAESRYATPERAEELLAAYETERRTTAAAMVGGVARVTSLMTSQRHIARHIRRTIAPRIVAKAFVQAKLARGVGMLNLSYSTRGASRDRDGLSAGRRLPNPELRDGGRLYDRLHPAGYNWVVLGGTSGAGASESGAIDPEAPGWMGLPVVAVPDSDLAQQERPFRRHQTVLVRPDLYIAAVGSDPESLTHALPGRLMADSASTVGGE